MLSGTSNLSQVEVQDAVLVLSLPNTAVFKYSSSGGIYWPARNQVFWKLGTLDPGASGSVAVRGTYQWGIPDLTLEASMASMLGTNLNNGQLVLSDYLNYQPYQVNSTTKITQPEFFAVLPGRPSLNALYNQALANGYLPGVYSQVSMSDGDQFHQAILLKSDLSEVVLVSGNAAGSLTYIIGRNDLTLVSTTEKITYDLQTGDVKYAPLSMTGQASLAASDKVNCLINCLIMETGTSLLSEFAPILGKIGTIADCTAFLAEPSNSEALASCAAGIQSSIPGAGTIVSAVNCYNRSLANPDYCKCTASMWEGTTMPLVKTEACKKTPCVEWRLCPLRYSCVSLCSLY